MVEKVTEPSGALLLTKLMRYKFDTMDKHHAYRSSSLGFFVTMATQHIASNMYT